METDPPRSFDPLEPMRHAGTGAVLRCPRCGRALRLRDVQAGVCPVDGMELDPYELGAAGDLHVDPATGVSDFEPGAAGEGPRG